MEGARNLYIVDPYVHYRLERTGQISAYEEISVAPYRRKTSSDLKKDHDFVQIKFEKYVNLLAERLNMIHGTNYGVLFWRRALSISFERYITFLHETFENCELYFKNDEHDCNVLSEGSYYIPLDFEEQRDLFQYSDYGQEQMFSIYMHTFYPAGLKTKGAHYKNAIKDNAERLGKQSPLQLLTQRSIKNTYEKVKAKLLEKFYFRKVHKIGIMGSFFSTENLNTLMLKSKGAIYPIEWRLKIQAFGNQSFSWDNRKYLTESRPDFDRFDLFFFASLKQCLPRIFIENFKEVESYYANYFKTYNHLEYVTSEAWLSSSGLTIALALLKERGVKHIYNEHNYLEHPWVGSLIPKEASLADIFISLGWDDGTIPNLIKGASLREFKLNKRPRKRYKICYIGSGALAKRPNYSASYGWCCENAPKYFNFINLFLGGLSEQARHEILVREYPRQIACEDILAYDQDFVLDKYLRQMQRNNDVRVSGKLIMLQSNLVIVDYLSTAYLESLIMNIPTIFFWNPDTCYLNYKHSDFFDAMISVGICQTDPIKAAHFVESIKDEPLKWWRQEAVQKAKNDFLEKNIGKPEVLVNILLGLAGEKGSKPEARG